MRRSLFFLLMVVLVLRGLAGTAMAAGMVPPLSATGAAHHPAAAAEHGGSHHGAQVATCDATAECPTHEHHASTCTVCEICHSVMLDAPATLLGIVLALGGGLPATCAQFESAPPALAIKPPIT